MYDWRYLIDREINRLEDVLENGLPAHYGTDYDAYMADWSKQFTQGRDIIVEFGWLLHSFMWVILSMKIEKKYGYDFVNTVRKAIDFFNDSLPLAEKNKWRERVLKGAK